MMKKPLLALAFVTLLGCATGACGGGASSASGPSAPKGVGCDQLSLHTSEQFDECRSKCRSEKQMREQSCNNDTQCMMAAGNQTQQCFGKCEEARTNARAKNCYSE